MSSPENEIHPDPESDPSAAGAEEPRAAGREAPHMPRSALARGLPEWDLLPPERPGPQLAPAD